MERNLKSRIQAALLFAVVIAALAGVPFLAWTSMNIGTFACFGLVAAWLVSTEWEHRSVERSLRLAEIRIRALEEYAGIRRAYCEEVEEALGQQKILKGAVADHLQWPRARDMARWRQRHWADWLAEQAALEGRAFEGDAWNALDEHQERKPYVPPPETASSDERLAYWSDPARWQ